MKFKDKIENFHNAMKRCDIPVNRVDPAVFKFVRIFGLKLKPPIFSSIGFNVITFLLVSVAFYFMVAAVALLLDLITGEIQVQLLKILVALFVFIIVFGLLGGLVFGIYQSMLKRKYNISSWQEFKG
jgi:hypothetical protein